MTTRDPVAKRASLDARLVNRAEETRTDVNRLCRQLVFQRILARLARDGRWVLKGGFALQVRLPEVARATVDLDLARVGHLPGHDIQEVLAAGLDHDVDKDAFMFSVGPARPVTADVTGNPGWRITVTSRLAGRTFATVHVDVVARASEIEGGVETLTVPPAIRGLGFTDVEMPTVDIAQHAAEKLHALARRYAGDRPSTRVKDLVDLALLIEVGLLPDDRLGARLRHVYAERGGSPPARLPHLPAAWRRDYAALAHELRVDIPDLDTAMDAVRHLYADALSDAQPDQETSP